MSNRRHFSFFAAGNYIFKVNNRNTETSEQLVLVYLLLTLSRLMPAGYTGKIENILHVNHLCSPHKETSQLICKAHQFTGFLIMGILVVNLLCKSMDWFLYDRDFRHERVNIEFWFSASNTRLLFGEKSKNRTVNGKNMNRKKCK